MSARSIVVVWLLGCSAPARAPATCGGVDHNDVAILDRALGLLASEQVWNRADDRNCPPGAATVSLFCALQQASIAVLGHYEHRRVALEEVRNVIDERTAGRDYAHRLRDYNNDPTTTLADVRSAITVARARVAARMCR